MGTTTNDLTTDAPRSAAAAMLRGAARRCPACGEGALYRGWLTIGASCPACGEALHHHRADDLPAYLSILVTGKLMIALLVFSEAAAPLGPSGAYIWPLAAVVCAAALLSPLKGAVVGLQWALRMHGFGGEPVADVDRPSEP